MSIDELKAKEDDMAKKIEDLEDMDAT